MTAAATPAALGGAALAGLASSIGPCVVPRYVAIAALARSRSQHRVVILFCAGLFGAYLATAFAAGFAETLWQHAASLDALLALIMAIAGAWLLLRPQHRDTCDAETPRGGPLLLGAASGLVLSPCCTPVIASLAAIASASQRPLDGVLLVAAFALGHSAPLFVAAYGSGRLTRAFERLGTAEAPSIVSGTLLLVLGAYHAVLA